MNKLLSLILILPLFLKSEEVISLDLSYSIPIDPYYCDNKPPECNPLPDILPKFDIQEGVTKSQWTVFWALQVLDIYSTAEAVKYDCIVEINPLLPERPSYQQLILTKGIILVPTMLRNNDFYNFKHEELDRSNFLQSIVVSNNLYLLNDAKQNCNRIR